MGDGVADDTVKLQNALNDLGTSGHSFVLYLPAGIYRIASTLTMASRINVSMIGEDPATTSILWAGPASGKMLYLNGVAYSRFNRMTWNGNRSAGILIDQSKSDGSSNYFDTANEYADDIFKDGDTGIRGGYLGFGFAETSVRRSQFLRLRLGISLGNFNALDLFVRFSRFEDCQIGVTNDDAGAGAGNFNVYSSIFKRSTFSDINIGNTGSFSLRDNYSIDSRRFIFAGFSTNPATITLQRNTILDPIADEPLPNPIRISNYGPLVLMDNVVRSLAGVTTQAVVNMGQSSGDLFSIGNTFTSSGPFTGVSARLHSIDDTTVTRASIVVSEPTLPGTPANLGRSIYEVSPGSSAATIQALINSVTGTRSVLHIPLGTLSINTTLTFPANSDMQVIGDGDASILSWTGGGYGPIVKLAGPSHVIIRDLKLYGANMADGLLIENADQPGSRVFIEQPYLNVNHANLLVDQLDYTNVQLQDFYHDGSASGQTSVKVIGGSLAAAGNWQGGKTNIFGGNSSANALTYEASQGAHVNVQDAWYETASGSHFINLTGISVFSFSGGRVALPFSASIAAFDVHDFAGKAAFLSSKIDGSVMISGNGLSASVLTLGLVGPADFYFNTTLPQATSLFINNQTWKPLVDPHLVESGSYDAAFIRAALSQIRGEHATEVSDLPAGVTDVRMYRVTVEQCLTGVHLKGI